MPVIGLQNQGNTCYMNSALQLIVNSTYIREEILNQDNKYARALQEIIKSQGTMTPSQIKQVMGQNHLRFSGYSQQDSHEFIALCLGHLEDSDCKEIKYYEEIDFDCDHHTGFQKYKVYCEKRQNSKLQQRLRFYKIQETSCEKCGPQGYSFHSDESLMLQIKQKSASNFISNFFGGSKESLDIEQLLDSYFEKEILYRRCKNCNGELCMKQSFWTLPDQLIVLFVRFTSKYTKLSNQINYKLQMCLQKYLHKDSPQNKSTYDLEAVSLHSGSTGGGHYTAFVITPDQQMYDCNDSHVSKARNVLNDSRAYVLSYALNNTENQINVQSEKPEIITKQEILPVEQSQQQQQAQKAPEEGQQVFENNLEIQKALE